MDLFTIPSLSGGKSGQKKKAKRVENRIDQNFMWELKQFYNENDCIKSCRKKKIESLVQHKANISWWFTKEVELVEIPIMNSETYLRALHDLLWIANDYLTLFGFVGFYIRKDIGEWVKNKEKHGGLLPFGVIEFGERKDQIPGYFVKRAKKSTIFGSEIVFNCTDDSKKLKYTFFVMDKNATFRIPITTNNNNNDFYPTEDSNSSNLIPNSSFEALFDKWRRIVEVVITLDDANAQSCRPEPFLLTKPLPETDITQTSESDRYLSNFLDEIGTEVALDKLQSGYEYASSHSQRMKCQTAYTQLQSMRYGGRKYVSMTEQRRMAFPHPTLTENLEVLPPMVTLDRGPPPKSLIDLNHLEETYEAQVCSVMCYPYLLFKSHSHTHSQSNKLKSGGGGGISNDSQKQAAEMELDKITQGQEALFQEIFTELYMRSYAFLDLETLSHIPQTYDPSFQFLLEGMNVRLVYNHQSPKSDLDIQNLSMLLNNGIISDKELRSQLVRYGISEEVDGVLRKPENSENKPKSKAKGKAEKKKKKKKEEKEESSESSGEGEDEKMKESEEKEKPEKTKENKNKKKKKKEGSESSSNSREEKESDEKEKKPEKTKEKKKKKKKKREESDESSTVEEKEERPNPKKKAKKD